MMRLSLIGLAALAVASSTDAANAFRTGYECEPGESGLVYRNLLFKDVFLNVKTMPITQGSKFCRTDEAGMLKGLVLRNIHLPDSHGGMCVNLSAHDDAHPIEDVRFENVTGYGPITKSGAVSFRDL